MKPPRQSDAKSKWFGLNSSKKETPITTNHLKKMLCLIDRFQL
ncbi:MAG: hypothetical protein WCI46_08460 [Verrucomicrobiota bacterium]